MKDPVSVQLLEALERTKQTFVGGKGKGVLTISKYDTEDIPDPVSYDLPDYDKAKYVNRIELDFSGEREELDFIDEVLDFLKMLYIHKEPGHEDDFTFKISSVPGKSNAFYIKEYVIDDDTGDPVYLGDLTVLEFSDGFKRREISRIRRAVAEEILD